MVDHIGRAIPHREHTGRERQGGGQIVEVDKGQEEKADPWEKNTTK